MREDILKNLQKEVYERCSKESNKFGMGCYYHIVSVVKNAEILAEHYGANKEVVMIAAWLHDIASVTDESLYENHHIHGAEIAYHILSEQGYDKNKITGTRMYQTSQGKYYFGKKKYRRGVCGRCRCCFSF